MPWMYSSCGHCEFCLAGMETICKSGEATGYTKPGGYAEYMVAPAAFVGRLPEGTDSYAMAPILCAGVTTYRGLKRTGARPGQWVTILGIGGLGHIAIQYARAMGLRVAAVDVSNEKLELAKSLGAEIVVNAAETDPVAGDPGEDRRRPCGRRHGGCDQSLRNSNPHAAACGHGLLHWTSRRQVGRDPRLHFRHHQLELSVRGSNVGTRQDLNEAIAFASNGLVKATIRTAPLEDINAIFDEMRRGKIVGRVVLKLA